LKAIKKSKHDWLSHVGIKIKIVSNPSDSIADDQSNQGYITFSKRGILEESRHFEPPSTKKKLLALYGKIVS
jgi:hypothetical protein